MPRRLVTLLCLLTLLVAPTARAQNWLPVGPPGGTVRSLAADPKDPRHLFLGTADGLLFTSDDDGRSWRRTSPGFPLRGRSLDQVTVDANGVVLVGYWRVRGQGGGVARSTDGGRTFRLLHGIDGESVRALAVAPSNPRVIAAGSLTGVFLSRDGGDSWARITPAGHPGLRNVESLAFDPADPRVLYAGTWHLGWKTADAGATWQPAHEGMIDDSDVMTLTVDRRDARTVYATACTGIFRSRDAADGWERIPGIPEASRRTRAFAQDVDAPDRLFAGTTKGLWLSEDGGAAWRLTTPSQTIVNAVLAQAGGTVLLGTEGTGVLRSGDGGRTWETSNAGFSDRFVSRLLFDPGRDRLYAADADGGGVFLAAARGGPWACLDAGLAGRHVLSLARLGAATFAGTDDGIYVRRAEATAWTRLATVVNGRETHPRVSELLAAPPARLLAATGAGILASSDGGAHWTRPEVPGSAAVLALAAFPGRASECVAATAGGFLHSTNGGDTWTLLAPMPAGVTPHALAVVPSAHPVLLATTSRGLLRSDDRGATWGAVTGGLPRADLSGLAVHPDGHTIFVTDFESGGIFASVDRGATWSRMRTGDLPSDRAWAIGLDPDAPERMFVASSSGLYVLEPPTATASADE